MIHTRTSATDQMPKPVDGDIVIAPAFHALWEVMVSDGMEWCFVDRFQTKALAETYAKDLDKRISA